MMTVPPRVVVAGVRAFIVALLLALTMVCATPASAATLTTTAARIPVTDAYSGWGYVAGAASQPAWRWTATGWVPTSFPAGKGLWVYPWGSGWNWVWVTGAWHAMRTTALDVWRCDQPTTVTSLTAPAGSPVLSGNASVSSVSATVPAGAILQLKCGNVFPDASGGAAGYALVVVQSGGAVQASGYVDIRLLSGAATTGRSVTVASIVSLLDALADDSVGEIVVANGTYRVSPAAAQRADSLWIGPRFAGRTRAVLVRAQTRGGVTFDGGGARYYGCITFVGGVHDQTWDGFNCAGGDATETGIVTVAGYLQVPGTPHHITMRHINILGSCTGRSATASSPAVDHAFYLSNAVGTGPHDLLFEDITVNGAGGLSSAFHFYHSEPGAPNTTNMVVRRLHVTGTQQAIILWDPTLRNITFDTVDVTGALAYGVRYETYGSTGIRLSNIVTRNSGQRGFYSDQGDHPAGVTFYNNSFG